MKTEIIAEIAQGYEGDSKLSELLVRGALIAGADSVKLQLVYADELCVPSYPYHSLFRSLEMHNSTWEGLVKMVRDEGKRIYFDVYGQKSLAVAKMLGADGVKISTTDFHNSQLIRQAFLDFETVFISVGGVPVNYIDEMFSTLAVLDKLVLMYGFQAEPTQVEDNNLARIKTLKSRYKDVDIGFMDHSLGSSPEAFQLSLLALGAGISCIEKHITLDYSLKIEDYISALSIDRFSEFVKTIRSLEGAIGSSDLILTTKEEQYGKRAGKVLVASQNLLEGHIIAESDISMKRFSTSPNDTHFCRVSDILGKTLMVPLSVDCPFDRNIVR